MIKSITVLAGFTGREFYVAITDDGEPLFCLPHVCRDLGITNATNCKRRLRPEGCHLVNLKKFLQSPRMGYPIANFVTQDNLNRCLFTSRKAVARDFQEWFNREVMPLFAAPETDTTQIHPASTQQAPNKCAGAKPETDFQQATPETTPGTDTTNQAPTNTLNSTPKTDTPMKPNIMPDKTNIQIFDNPTFGEIRTTTTEQGEPLFCLVDICQILDLQASAVVRRLDEGVISSHPLETAGGTQQANFVNEDGLYDVILDSRKPEARAFRKWITSDVIPSIRKHGAYMTPEAIERTLADPDYLISLATALKDERARRLKAQAEAQAQKALLAKTEKVLQETAKTLREAKPKADYCDNVLQSVSLISVRQIAKDFGRSAEWLNKYLNTKGIQFRQGRQWILYQKYADMDLARSVTAQGSGRGDDRTFMLTKWTERGRRFITGLLAQDGIFPVPTAQERALVDAQLELIYE